MLRGDPGGLIGVVNLACYALVVTPDAGHELLQFGLWVGDFDYELVVRFVVKCNHYRVVGIMHVVKHTSAVLVEGASGYESGDVRAWHSEPVPPATRRVWVDRDTSDVRERNFDPALERPELIHSVDFEYCLFAINRDADQAGLRE